MESRSQDIDTATPGTCEWFFRHDAYTSWKESDRGLLWIKGRPGSGKSTLIQYALSRIQAERDQNNEVILSFFFHGRGAELQRTLLGLFQSLFHQLLTQVPEALQDFVKTFEERCKRIGEPDDKKWKWHWKDLRTSLRSLLPNILESRSIWLFVDALDESSDEMRDTIREFQMLLKETTLTDTRFHICFSCRNDLIYNRQDEPTVYLENENREDISNYVQAKFATSTLSRTEIPHLITDQACGLFIWAHLVVEQVLELEDKGKGQVVIQQRINSIPPDLDLLYRQLVEKMDEKQASLRLIRWICFASRPLSLSEIGWAMAMDTTPPPKSVRECTSKDDGILSGDVMTNRVKSLSRGLIEVSTSSNKQVVQFIHQSVKDYFIDKGMLTLAESPSLEFPDGNIVGHAHYRLSRACICYFAMEEIGQSILEKRDSMAHEFPFLEYATFFWVSHTLQSQSNNVRQDDLLDYFNWPSEELMQRWVQAYQTPYSYSSDCPPDGTNMVHVVSRYGLIGPLQTVLQRANQVGANIDKRDDLGRTPLSWAAGNGQEAAVKLLLKETGNGWVASLLLWAAKNLRNAFIKMAIIKPYHTISMANVTIKGGRWVFIPLLNILIKLLATLRGLLANARVDANAKDKDGWTPLSWAVKNGQRAVVKLLLATGKFDVNATDNDNLTPLQLAVHRQDEDAVKLLLTTGKADVDTISSDGQTPLLWAIKRGYDTIVKLLLTIGKANVNAKDKEGRTPLWLAAENKHEPLLKLLLDTGKADADAIDGDGRTLLLWAVEKGYMTMIDLLLDTGKVDVNAKDKKGRTPLLLAAQNKDEGIVKLLLATGKANVHAKDNEGRTSLMLASISNRRPCITYCFSPEKNDFIRQPISEAERHEGEAVVKLLLDTGSVDVNAKDDHGKTPLSFAAENGRESIARLLLATEKVDYDAEDDNGVTPLMLATKNVHEPIVKLLLAKFEVDITTKKYDSQTSFLLAAKTGDKGVVEQLLATGKVDVNARTKRGETSLLLAVRYDRRSVAETLLTVDDIDINSKDIKNRTPLILAAVIGNIVIAKLLLAAHKTDVNAKDINGWTPLMFAATEGYMSIVKLLLDTKKIDINTKNNDSQTPLLLAAANGHECIVKSLLDMDDVDIHAKDYIGLTPFAAAAMYGYQAVIEQFLAIGKADIEERDYSGQTPISIAAMYGHETVVKQLLATGKCDADAKDHTARTPLSYAARGGYETVAMTLLNHGSINPDQKDHYGLTPLSIAVRHNRVEVAKLLLATGQVTLDSQDDFGRTPWYWAKRCGNAAIQKTLFDHARENSVSIPDIIESVERMSVSDEDISRWCDICTMGILENEVIYTCTICKGGNFYACLECHSIGGRCLSEDHRMVKGRNDE